MDSAKRLLVYDDNPEFGGHQVMAAHGIEAMVETGEWEIHCWVNPDNHKWHQRLSLIQSPSLRIGECPTRTRRLQVVRNKLERSPGFRRALRQLQPDLVLFIQGDIEHSSLAVLETQRLGQRLVSYIPMAHRYGVMQARLAWLRDLCARRVYRSISRWITISPGIAQTLGSRSPGSHIDVVDNGIQMDGLDADPGGELRLAVRRELGLGLSSTVCAMIGRIEFNQKRQDLTVEAFAAYPEEFSGCELLIVGSGPDDGRLEALIRGSRGRDHILRVPWMENPHRLYAAMDCLLLPSGYEGVPLVMLEALAAAVPVIASDRDGMRDILPSGWLFEGGAKEMAQAFSRARQQGFMELRTLQRQVRERNSLDAFRHGFVASIRRCMDEQS